MDAYVIDATMCETVGPLCFCPVEFDERGEISSILTGLSYLSSEPPEGSALVGVVHADGDAAVEAWCWENADTLDDLRARFPRESK